MIAGRVRAPQTNGGLLVSPGLDGLTALLRTNRDFLSSWDYDVQGRSAISLRETARRELAALSRDYLGEFGLTAPPLDDEAIASAPLIATGHQPELFHPGVWVKNFAAWSLARAFGGWSVNLIVDNDIPKSAAILAPRLAGGRLKLERVEFDRLISESPYEDWSITDPAALASFPGRSREVVGELAPDWLLGEFWPRVLGRPEIGHLGQRFALARRETEESWGVANQEAPVSRVAESTPFLWFVSHLLARLPRYVRVHNQALEEYRAAHGIRSKNHPVAALASTRDGWLEAPFWAWRREQPRRRPLLARQNGRLIQLRIAGEDGILAELPLSEDAIACCAVEQLRDLASAGIRIRPRALTTTMFTRYFVADLFIHGIGGAKYDELGDVVSQRFLGAYPPGFLTLSLTLWLAGLPQDSTNLEAIRRLDRRARDLIHHPERVLGEQQPPDVRNIIEAKRAAIAGPVGTRLERKSRWAAIRRCNQALEPLLRDERDHLLLERANIAAQDASNRVARNREFSIILHSRERLREAMMRGVSDFAVVGSGPGALTTPHHAS